MYKSKYKKASSRIKRRGKTKRFFSLFLKIGLPIVLLIGLIFILRADFLQVKNFEIVGTETILAENIKNTAQNQTLGNRLFFIPKSNILFLSKNNLASILLSNFSRLEKVEINKKFFSQQIQLKITERKSEFLWCSVNNECFSMTKEGLVFASSAEASANEETDINNKIIFRGVLEGNPLMKNFATAEKMQNYENLIESFRNAGFDVSAINIESSDKAIAKIKINNKISDIIFSPAETNLSLVAQNTILLINNIKNKNPSAVFNYIDARFDNKFFYKLY